MRYLYLESVSNTRYIKFSSSNMESKAREIINYDIIKVLMLSSESRDFVSFFAQLIVTVLVTFNFSQKLFFPKIAKF